MSATRVRQPAAEGLPCLGEKARVRRASLAGSAFFVMGATLASTLLGFLREIVNAKYYGTQWQLDAFLAASVIPTILFAIFNYGLISALVPVFSEYLVQGRDDEAWRLGSTVVNLLGIGMVGCALLGYMLAPWYVPLIAHGFPEAQMRLATHMTRWLMPSVIAVALAGVLTGILNANRRFRAAAMIGAVLNLVTIGSVVLLNHKLGIYALAAGTACGLIAQFLVQIPAFLALRGYRFIIDIHHPGLKSMLALLGPIVVGSAAGQLGLFFDRFFASMLPPGSMAGMNYATKLVNFPQQIFASAIATVIFPVVAQQFAQANRESVARNTITGLRLVNFITIPSACLLIVLARPIVQTLFQRGNFGPSSVNLTVGLLPFAAVGLIAMAANLVLTPCLFACRQTKWPVAASVGSVVLNVILSLAWLPTLGARGLLLANSVSQTIQMLLIFVLIARLMTHINWGTLLLSTLRIGACTLAMLLVLDWVVSLLGSPNPSLLSRAWFLFREMAIAGVVFVGVARMLGIEELLLAWRAILARFERNVPPPPEGREVPIA
jgi:putative peptidoglycan lipid II flippase